MQAKTQGQQNSHGQQNLHTYGMLRAGDNSQ